MASKKDPRGALGDVATRVRRLREALGYGQTTAFATYLGVPRSRLANVEGGHPLGSDLARRIRQRTGASLDWLYEGDWGNMPHGLAVKLQEADAGGRKGKIAVS